MSEIYELQLTKEELECLIEMTSRNMSRNWDSSNAPYLAKLRIKQKLYQALRKPTYLSQCEQTPTQS